jgi:hypothetical protein
MHYGLHEVSPLDGRENGLNKSDDILEKGDEQVEKEAN